jgi:hypothetical protein
VAALRRRVLNVRRQSAWLVGGHFHAFEEGAGDPAASLFRWERADGLPAGASVAAFSPHEPGSRLGGAESFLERPREGSRSVKSRSPGTEDRYVTRCSVRLVGVINVVTVVLAIAVLVILGMLFGWRIPVAVIVFYALWGLRLVTEPPEPGRLPVRSADVDARDGSPQQYRLDARVLRVTHRSGKACGRAAVSPRVNRY